MKRYMSDTPANNTWPVLPLKNTVVYPRLLVPLQVGRPRSMAAIEAAQRKNASEPELVVVGQRDLNQEEPGRADLYDIGTLVTVRRAEISADSVQLLVQGVQRVRLGHPVEESTYMAVPIERIDNLDEPVPEDHPLLMENRELARQIALLYDAENGERLFNQLVGSIKDPLLQMYRIASLANLDLEKEQAILEADSMQDLLQQMNQVLRHEMQLTEVRRQIASQARDDIEKQQREQLLRQQKRTIEQALGEESPEAAEAAELRRRLEETELPEAVRKEAERECQRMERMSHNAADFQVARTYLELILELPWSASTDDELDLDHAKAVLDEDHFGLEDIKDRILEFLAVMKKNPEAKAPILCFVGPPGVGKTSLGQSIARAMGRRFERMSLGGLHDEAELRGHRRTYIGAMPGRVLQAVRRAEVNNPLLMLDEIDKLGRDFRGDPAAALMEILDPAQNSEFRDNYLNLPFDLSRVFFIATANTLDGIPRPLLDRMEILQLSGYSDAEKLEIARRYLVPRQRQAAGLTESEFVLDDDALRAIIHRYTREAGVRELERVIARVARKQARRLLQGEGLDRIESRHLTELLGPEKFFPERVRHDPPPGVAAGRAWTESGGDVLYVEATPTFKEDRILLTGSLGDVMQESARAARSYIYTVAASLGVDREQLANTGVHIHVPSGAVPKDGPSAGVTIATALASMYTGRRVDPDLAMTGEITLTGLVLPVGGIKEKVLAAHRAGIRRLILPKENASELARLPEHVAREMQFQLVERVDEVFELALLPAGAQPGSNSTATALPQGDRPDQAAQGNR